MLPQSICMRRGKVTLVAFVWLFSTVHFNMTSQAAFHRGCILTLVALVWFFSFIICASQRNIYIDPTFTEVIICMMRIHHHQVQVGNVIPCLVSFKLRKFGLWIRRVNKWKWEPLLKNKWKTVLSNPWQDSVCCAWNALPNNVENKVEAIMEPFSVPRRGSNLGPLGWQPSTLTTRLSETS